MGGGPCEAPFSALLRQCERLQIAGSQKGLSWKAVAQPHLPMALFAQRQREWSCLLVLTPHTGNVIWEWGASLPGSFLSPVSKMRMSADRSQPEETRLESCCSASSAHGTGRTEAQRLGLLACLDTSHFKRILGTDGVPAGLLSPPCSKMRTSADSWQPEGAILEICWSASCAQGTDCTEAQRVGLLACLDTSHFKRTLGMGGVPSGLLSQPCSKNRNVCR